MQIRVRKADLWCRDNCGPLLWVVPLALVAALVFLITEILNVEGRLAVYYGSMYAVTAGFCVWNVYDRWIDWQVQRKEEQPPANIKLAAWRLRQNTLIGLCALCGLIAGIVSTFQLAAQNVVVVFLFLSGLCLMACAAWDRTSRWDVIQALEREREENARKLREAYDG